MVIVNLAHILVGPRSRSCWLVFIVDARHTALDILIWSSGWVVLARSRHFLEFEEVWDCGLRSCCESRALNDF